MKRFSQFILGFILTLTLVATALVASAKTPALPKSLSTCTDNLSREMRILDRGTCRTTETQGSWISLAGISANSRVIFTCMDKGGDLRMYARGDCDSESDLKSAWTRADDLQVDLDDLICAAGGRCVVGDIGPGGGMVFYVAKSRQWWGRYLEAANPVDWQPKGPDPAFIEKVGTEDPEFYWCNRPDLAVGADGIKIGTGLSNTKKVVAKCKSGAAVAVSQFRGGDKTDWYLPSKDELTQIWLNIYEVFGFSLDAYWTSSESDASSAWWKKLNIGTQGQIDKDIYLFVRPIRAF